jgi:hypothetical protein
MRRAGPGGKLSAVYQTGANTLPYYRTALFAVVSLIICGLAAPSTAQEFMTRKELQATIPGATLYGISNQDKKTRWVQTYSKGRRQGAIAGLWGKQEYKAKWKIKGSFWCEEWSDGSGCWKLVRVDATTLHPYRDGKEYTGAIWNIRK